MSSNRLPLPAPAIRTARIHRTLQPDRLIEHEGVGFGARQGAIEGADAEIAGQVRVEADHRQGAPADGGGQGRPAGVAGPLVQHHRRHLTHQGVQPRRGEIRHTRGEGSRQAVFRGEIHIDDLEGGETTLVSWIHGERRELTDARLLWYAVRYPALTLLVIARIHWQAFRLWLKKLPFHRKAENPGLQRDLHRPHPSLTESNSKP